MELFIAIIKIGLSVGGGIVIKITTDNGRFEFIKAHLRLTWIVFLIFVLFLFVSDSHIWEIIMAINKQYLLFKPLWFKYGVCFIVGGLILCGVYWLSGKITGSNTQGKKTSSKVIITARELALIPFIDHISKQNFVVKLSFYNEGNRDCSIEEVKLLIPNEQTLLTKKDNDQIKNK